MWADTDGIGDWVMSRQVWEVVYRQSVGGPEVVWDGPCDLERARASFDEMLQLGYRPVVDDMHIVRSWRIRASR